MARILGLRLSQGALQDVFLGLILKKLYDTE